MFSPLVSLLAVQLVALGQSVDRLDGRVLSLGRHIGRLGRTRWIATATSTPTISVTRPEDTLDCYCYKHTNNLHDTTGGHAGLLLLQTHQQSPCHDRRTRWVATATNTPTISVTRPGDTLDCYCYKHTNNLRDTTGEHAGLLLLQTHQQSP